MAVDESEVDGNTQLMDSIRNMISPTKAASISLEQAGASIIQRESPAEVAKHFISCGEALEVLSMKIKKLDPDSEEGKLSSSRMFYASEQIILAGKELSEKKEKPKGKAWIKG